MTYPGLSSLALFTVGATTCVAGGETITDVVGAGESAGTGSTGTSVKRRQNHTNNTRQGINN